MGTGWKPVLQLVLIAFLCMSAKADPPANFPQFIVPGHEQQMQTLRDLFWLHHQRRASGDALG